MKNNQPDFGTSEDSITLEEFKRKNMTNTKLPEVGSQYRYNGGDPDYYKKARRDYGIFTVARIVEEKFKSVPDETRVIMAVLLDGRVTIEPIEINNFWKNYEELPQEPAKDIPTQLSRDLIARLEKEWAQKVMNSEEYKSYIASLKESHNLQKKPRYLTREEANAWNEFCGFPLIPEEPEIQVSEDETAYILSSEKTTKDILEGLKSKEGKTYNSLEEFEKECGLSEVDKALEELKKYLDKDVPYDDCLREQSFLDCREKAENLVNALEAEKKESIDMPSVLPAINRYVKNYFFDQNKRLPDDISEALELVNSTCWQIFMSKSEPKIDIKEESVYVSTLSCCKNCHREFKQFHRSDYFCSNYCRSGLKPVEPEKKGMWKSVSELPRYPLEHASKILVKYKNDEVELRQDDESYVGDEKFCTLTDLINSFEQLQRDVEEMKKATRSKSTQNPTDPLSESYQTE